VRDRWCRGRLSDETFVVGYEPCNDHKNEPGFGPLTQEGRVERRCKLCLAVQPRYQNGADGTKNPLPPELHPLGIVANASKAGRERLAAALRAARAERTWCGAGVGVRMAARVQGSHQAACERQPGDHEDNEDRQRLGDH
jgi:hypothetical protein